ncbi:MAG: hypothetical protein WCV68_00055 [Candidatus Paceibacterota bacterium]|jgi:hypothetical protein
MDDLTTKTDEELLAIIRRCENSNVPGILYQRASQELSLRDRDKIINRPNNSGLFLRVGGDMLFDGTIQGPQDGPIDIAVAGNYKSKSGKIIQGGNDQEPIKRWWENNWFQIIALIGAIVTIVSFVIWVKGLI